MARGAIKCQGFRELSQGSIQSACNVCKVKPKVENARGTETARRADPSYAAPWTRFSLPGKHEVSAAPYHAVIGVDQRRTATLGCDALGA